MDEILRYLESVRSVFANMTLPRDAQYSCVEDFIYQLGRKYTPAPWKLQESYHRRTPKECFANATQLAIIHSELTYVEGFVYKNGIIPLIHAWCVDDAGVVYDPTLLDPENCFYLGVPLKIEFVLQTIEAKGTYGVIDNYEHKFPMLRGVYQQDEYLAK